MCVGTLVTKKPEAWDVEDTVLFSLVDLVVQFITFIIVYRLKNSILDIFPLTQTLNLCKVIVTSA